MPPEENEVQPNNVIRPRITKWVDANGVKSTRIDIAAAGPDSTFALEQVLQLQVATLRVLAETIDDNLAEGREPTAVDIAWWLRRMAAKNEGEQRQAG